MFEESTAAELHQTLSAILGQAGLAWAVPTQADLDENPGPEWLNAADFPNNHALIVTVDAAIEVLRQNLSTGEALDSFAERHGVTEIRLADEMQPETRLVAGRDRAPARVEKLEALNALTELRSGIEPQ